MVTSGRARVPTSPPTARSRRSSRRRRCGRSARPAWLADGLGGDVTIAQVPVPLDCTDGFNEAYYGRAQPALDGSLILVTSRP